MGLIPLILVANLQICFRPGLLATFGDIDKTVSCKQIYIQATTGDKADDSKKHDDKTD